MLWRLEVDRKITYLKRAGSPWVSVRNSNNDTLPSQTDRVETFPFPHLSSPLCRDRVCWEPSAVDPHRHATSWRPTSLRRSVGTIDSVRSSSRTSQFAPICLSTKRESIASEGLASPGSLRDVVRFTSRMICAGLIRAGILGHLAPSVPAKSKSKVFRFVVNVSGARGRQSWGDGAWTVCVVCHG